MKRKTTATGLLTLVAMVVLGVVSAGSASAVSQFLWTGPLPGLLLVLSQNPQVFIAEPGAAEVICQHFTGHGILSNGKAMSAKEVTITGNYTSCKAAGIFEAVTSPAEFLVNADGSVGVVGKPIVITVTALGCSLKINNGNPNNTLKTIKFLNLTLDVLAHIEVAGITSLASGGECGTKDAEKSNGVYRGLLLIFVHGGTVRWDP